jgi:hypothetical protein
VWVKNLLPEVIQEDSKDYKIPADICLSMRVVCEAVFEGISGVSAAK